MFIDDEDDQNPPEGDESTQDVGSDTLKDEIPVEKTDAEIDEEWSAATLDQNAIDDLFGNGEVPQETAMSGMSQILQNSTLYYERLPMLEVVFDRLVRMLSTSLRNFTSENIEVTLESTKSVRFEDYMDSIPLPAMLGVFRAREWDNSGLIIMDSPLIYAIVDILLGGRRGKPMKIEGRPYTTIERSLMERLMQLILADLQFSFKPIVPIHFDFERLEINPRFASIVRPGNAAIIIRLKLEMEERSGIFELLLPYATIEPIRELLLQKFMGEKFGRDSIWERHLAEQLWDTDFTLELKMNSMTDLLRNVLNWEVGTQIIFNNSPRDSLPISCYDQKLFTGKIGQKGGCVAVRVDDILINQGESL